MTFRSVFLTLALILTAPPVSSQVIPVTTVPVASGDQFLLFPSNTRAMGGVGLALADTLGDPFSNPATGGRVQESVVFGSPTYYGISDRNGSGRSLPLGAFISGTTWFGGGALALQELEGAERDRVFWPLFADARLMLSSFRPWPDPTQDLSQLSARNLYAFGFLGIRFPEHGLAVGVSGSYADLKAVDGVELLYAQARDIRQGGHVSDLRLGLVKEWDDHRSLELVLLRSRVRMRHDVTYLNLVWEPIPPDDFEVPQWRTREEENLDHTNTWGAHLAYRRPMGTRGWQVGWSLTANRKDHPKIPNYEIQNIPRDPGDTWAYRAGVGVAKTVGPGRFAAELFLEPIRSETWADAASDTVDVQGNPILAGEKTVENDFSFTNVLARIGGALSYRMATVLAGIQARSISYELDQFDVIQRTRRAQDESWMEWTPSLGIHLDLEGVGIRWMSRLTTGTGRPGTFWTPTRVLEASGASSLDNTDFLVAPGGPLTLQDARVTTHQLAVVIPMG